MVNHFPNHYELTRKDLVVKNIKKYQSMSITVNKVRQLLLGSVKTDVYTYLAAIAAIYIGSGLSLSLTDLLRSQIRAE